MRLHEYAARAAAAADYVRDWFGAQRSGLTLFAYRAQKRRAEEARIEATTVDVALADASPEAAIQLAGQRDAFVRRIDELRAPGRSLTRPESLELFHLAESVKRIDAATFGAGAIDPATPLAAFGPVGQRRGFLASLAGGVPIGWVAGGVAVAVGLLGLQSGRIANLKGDLTERTRERDAALAYGNEMAALAQARERDVASVRAENTRSVELAESVQARNARLEARERERTRLAQENRDAVTVDFSERLRDLTVRPLLSDPAAGSDPAPGVPDGAGGNSAP